MCLCGINLKLYYDYSAMMIVEAKSFHYMTWKKDISIFYGTCIGILLNQKIIRGDIQIRRDDNNTFSTYVGVICILKRCKRIEKRYPNIRTF